MPTGQFLRFLIMRFYCQKDSRYMTRNQWKKQDEEKKQLAYFGLRTPGRVQRTMGRVKYQVKAAYVIINFVINSTGPPRCLRDNKAQRRTNGETGE